MSWAPSGDRLAYFVRTEKSRTLILQNVVTRKIEERFDMRTVDEPESPDISPDGRRVVFAALQGGVGDIFMLDLQTRAVTNLTKDAFGDSGPDLVAGRPFIVYVARVSGNEKLFRLDLDTGRKTQITFGTHDDSAAQFVDQDTLVFSSTATDPSQPIDPDVARNGNIYNIWTLNLKNGELRQYTDALGGNTIADRAAPRQRAAADRRSSATTRATTSCTRSTGATRSSPPPRPTSARPGRSSTSRRRCRTRWSPTRSGRRASSRRCSSTAGRR